MNPNKMADVKDFISQKKIAVVGASRTKHKFGNSIFRELKKRDYQVFPINVNAKEIEGVTCYPDIKSLPEPVDGIVTVVKPEVTEQVVKEAAEAGVTRVWMQQGSHSETALAFCKEKGMVTVYNDCILMFLEPVGALHGFHRWLWKIFKKLPA